VTPQNKERIVGCLVLLCLAIIFIPPLYDGRNPFDQRVSIEQRKFPKPPVFPETEKMANSLAEVGSGRINDIEKKVKDSLPESAKNDSQLDEPAEKKPDTSNKAKEMTSRLLSDIAKRAEVSSRFTKDSDASLKQAWAVQVGSFKEIKGAQTTRDRLIDKNYQSYIKTVLKNGETISRVFAGVSLDKSIATEIKNKLAKDFSDLPGIVVPYQP